MPRLFTGIEVPREIATELAAMRGGIPGARWVEPENYHITLRFIGDIDEHTAGMLADALDDITVPPFDLMLKGAGYFGNRKPRNLWVGVKPLETISALQSAHERLCERFGIKGERRKFIPHVTLARLKNSAVRDVETYVFRHNLFETPPFEVNRFVLFSSRPSRGGGPYVAEEVYDLAHDF